MRLLERLQPSHLVHLAWYTVAERYWGALDNILWLEASLALVRAFARCGGRRALLIGSCAEYDLRSGGTYSEDMKPSPATLYGACKLALQSVTAAASAGLNVTVAWARLFYLFGPGEHADRLVSSVVNSLIRDQPAMIRHGRLVRDFMYAEDAAAALVSVLASEWSGPINVASGSPVSVATISSDVARIMHKPHLMRCHAVASAIQEPDAIVADVTRLRDRVGWTPQFTREEGLERTIRWWYDQPR
jgi:nucleoside-diphosphate-sugar epimerase